MSTFALICKYVKKETQRHCEFIQSNNEFEHIFNIRNINYKCYIYNPDPEERARFLDYLIKTNADNYEIMRYELGYLKRASQAKLYSVLSEKQKTFNGLMAVTTFKEFKEFIRQLKTYQCVPDGHKARIGTMMQVLGDDAAHIINQLIHPTKMVNDYLNTHAREMKNIRVICM